MELDELKRMIDTHHKAGRDREEVTAIISQLWQPSDNHSGDEPFQYLQSLYDKPPDASLPEIVVEIGRAHV